MKYLIYAMPLTRGEDEILMDDHAAHSVSECPLPSLDDHLLKVGEYVSIRMSPFMLWFSVDRCHRTARESQKKKTLQEELEVRLLAAMHPSTLLLLLSSSLITALPNILTKAKRDCHSLPFSCPIPGYPYPTPFSQPTCPDGKCKAIVLRYAYS